ncbi:MAG: corrinoid protein [bacterium]|nr:corrinoid protein [bacterium]
MATIVPTPEDIRKCVLSGDVAGAKVQAQASLAAGLPLQEAFDPFVKAIREAGDLFEQGEFFLPQLLLAANAMQAALDVIFPETDQQSVRLSRGTVIAGTVHGDIHVIGKNLVCALLSANGFKVFDLGADVSCEKFVEAARQHKADFLVLSALLTTTMVQQKQMIETLKTAGLRSKVKVLVGGAPVTPGWAQEIGADGYAPDAPRAVDLALRLLV